MRRSNHPEIAPQGSGSPQRQPFAPLDRTQQLDLNREGNIPDFVQKDGPLMGDFQNPFTIPVRPGERASNMTKQLALNQIFVHRCNTNRHEGLVRSRTMLMDRFCDELFPRPAFTRDKHGHIALGRLCNLFENALNGGRASDHPRRRTDLTCRLVLTLVKNFRPKPTTDHFDGMLQFEGLGQILKRR